MFRLRWPSGERNLDRKELRFRLAGDVEGLEGGGLEDMTRSRCLLHPYKTGWSTSGRGRGDGEDRTIAGVEAQSAGGALFGQHEFGVMRGREDGRTGPTSGRGYGDGSDTSSTSWGWDLTPDGHGPNPNATAMEKPTPKRFPESDDNRGMEIRRESSQWTTLFLFALPKGRRGLDSE